MMMINRRDLLKKILLGVIGTNFLSLRFSSDVIASDEQSVYFQWRVPGVHYQTVKKELYFEGDIKEEQGTKGGWIFVFIGASLIPYLAKAVLALRREIVHGGVIIDTRGEIIDINTDKSLPGGVIIIVTPEGSKYYERNEISDPTELVGALIKGLK